MVKFTGLKSEKLTLNPIKNLKDIKKLGLGEKPTGTPPGTVPVGDSGWYKPPDDPPDPMDCTRWPNSPWCKTGLPDWKKPFYIEVSPQVHQCGFDIDLTGAAFYLPLPTSKFAYRYEGECRKDPPPPPTPDLNKPGTYIKYPNGIDLNATVYAFVGFDKHNKGFFMNYDSTGQYVPFEYEYSQEGKWVDYSCPGLKVRNNNNRLIDSDITGTYYEIKYDSEDAEYDPPKSTGNQKEYFYFSAVDNNHGVWEDFGIDENGNKTWYSYAYGSYTKLNNNPTVATLTSQSALYAPLRKIYKGRWGDILKHLFSIQAEAPANTANQKDAPVLFKHVDFVIRQDCNATLEPYRKNPPPDKKDCNCMSCCPDYSSAIRQLSAEVKKINTKLGEYPFNVTIFDEDETRQEAQGKTLQIGNISSGIRTAIDRNEKVAKIIGIDALPLEVPKSICDPTDSNIIGAVWDWLTGSDKQKINNLFEYHVWMLNQFSAVMGHWQLEIKVDTDQLKEGEQGIPTADGEKRNKIALPDVASTLKELMMLQIQQYKTQGLILDVALKTLTESASTHQTAARTVAQIEEIVEFLDYPTDDASIEVPVQITVPGKDISQEDQNDIGKYLKPSKTKVRYDKWTKDQSLSDLLTHLATLIGSRGGAGNG